MKNKFRLICPWCKKKAVIKSIHPYGFEIWECQNCQSWCGSLFTYTRKFFKYYFRK